MTFPFMMMAAQAVGIGASMYSQNKANRRANRSDRTTSEFDRIGSEMDRMQMETRLQEEQLASSQESLVSLENLREVMATQRAIFGARNQNAGIGTAKAIETRSMNAFNSDEIAKNLSLTFRQNYIKSQMRLANIQGAGRQAQRLTAKADRRSVRNSNLIGQGLNMFSFNMLGENPFAGKGGVGG